MALTYGTPTQQILEAGMDAVINNTRVRASNGNANAAAYGTAAANVGVNWMDGVGTPYSATSATAFTLSAASLGTGICVLNSSASGSAVTATLDTAANIVAYVNNNSSGAVIGDYISALIVNGSTTSGNTITLAAGSGGGFDTNQGTASRQILLNSSKYIFVRLTNVTSGSEAYVVYS